MYKISTESLLETMKVGLLQFPFLRNSLQKKTSMKHKQPGKCVLLCLGFFHEYLRSLPQEGQTLNMLAGKSLAYIYKDTNACITSAAIASVIIPTFKEENNCTA